VLKQALRHYDAAQEKFERTVVRFKGKRKMLESTDMETLNTQFREMNDKFGGVETELTNLAKVVAAV
jgi:hypothetical protein